MDSDEAAGSSRRMDLNLYLGLPRVPRLRRPDLGSDLSLGTPMPSSPSSSAASVDAPPPPEPEPLLPPYSPSRAGLSSAPPEAYSPYNPEDSPAPEAHLPYMPRPERLTSELHDDIRFAAFQHPPPLVRASELLDWDSLEDRPSSSTASSSFFPDSAARYRRLLQQTGSRWLRTRRFRSDLPPLSSEARLTGQDVAVPVPRRETVSNTAEVNMVTAVVAEFENSTEDRGKTAATFECNICFDMASEPVVTSCGHLFCWPCLYQWLNVYSNHKECPVCKGEVTEANITPIYGRGNSDVEKTVEDVKPPAGPAIPPRPHGNRLESFRQQFHNMRPISRRLGETHGILSSWRRLLDQQIMNSASRIEGSSEDGQEINDNAQHIGRLSRLGTLASWMRARRLQRETEGATEGGSSGPDSVLPGNDASELPTRGSTPLDLLEHLAMIGIANTERLSAAMSARRIASPSQYGGSTSSSNPQNNEPTVGPTHVAGGPSADQASNSSTVAVIQGDAGISESAGEPSNAGSSRSLGRRTRSNTLGSLDVDGEGLQRNKRRRMN
jgi:E3 ubiquitin-protein ligase RNF5